MRIHKLTMYFVLWIVYCAGASTLSVYGADGQIKITQPSSFPIVIDRAGSYVVTCTIIVPSNVNGIEISADNVSLELNGHTLIGPGKENGSSGHGIYASNRNTIAIINGSIRDFAESGITLTGTGHRLQNISASSNGLHGISATTATIVHCTVASNSSHGMYASGSTITGCIAKGNGKHGISATSSTIEGCAISNQGSHGMYASHCTIVNNVSYDNDGRGIHASDSTIAHCTVNLNGSHGIYASSGCRMEGNNMRNNGGYGIYLSSSNNYVIKNVASANTSGNFYGVANNYLPTSGDNANYGW